MDTLLFVLMIGILVYVSVKNFSLIKRYKQNKAYISCYQGILNEENDCYDNINKYIESEKSLDFSNKAKIIKLYYELAHDISYEGTIESINFENIFYTKGKADNHKINLNSDAFVFIFLVIAKAFEKKEKDATEKVITKLKELSDLENRLEYQETVAFVNAVNSKDDNGLKILHSLLEGTYTEYIYEKNLIGLYKRFASAILTFKSEEIDEYFMNDLYVFSGNKIGECFLKSLGLYETYKPRIEEEDNE